MISMSSIKMFKFKAFFVTGVATLGAISAQPAQAITGFTGPYAPANWSFTNSVGGSVDTSGAPGSITLTLPQNHFVDTYGNYTTASQGSGQVSFDWACLFTDSTITFLLNGVQTLIANDWAAGDFENFGTGSFVVSNGDTFDFLFANLNIGDPTNCLTISNFSFSAPTPPAGVPGPLPLFGAGAAYGWSRRLRRRLSNPKAKTKAKAKAIPTIA
jgi:hypothetical protein